MDNVEIKKNIGLYIHIPFCIRKCLYCDFLSGAADDNVKKEYVSALISEIRQWKGIIRQNYNIKTIFVGGGTPTCLEPELLYDIGNEMSDIVDSVEEFTIEANPGTITKKHIDIFKEIGVNRVSLGLQSAVDAELKKLGRIHTYEDFLKSYDMVLNGGITNINIDIMSDIPGQTLESYQYTLNNVVKLKPEHISAYSLIIEPETPFYEMEQSGKLDIADEDTDRKMYHFTKEFLRENGYKRYEISNYSHEGMECKHNMIYWRADEYLGVGLGASSYLAGMRFSNERKLEKYIEVYHGNEKSNVFDINMNRSISAVSKIVSEKKIVVDYSEEADKKTNAKESAMLAKFEEVKNIADTKEDMTVLDRKDMMEEFMFLGFRMCEGVSYKEFEKRFCVDIREIYGSVIDKFLQNRLLAEDCNSGRIYLTERGIDISNYVMSEFML